jgi:asparagine synthase (glutamine-hydrolysing)
MKGIWSAFMCGIAGYVLRDGWAELDRLRPMCDRIRHRGPDDEGFYVDGPCALGMRRLSIIDLATGHQPISNENETLWVVFNGEIYNYAALRRELAGEGHVFKTNTDTEALLHLYEEEGVAGLSKLRGMFAFAIWDETRRELLLARDRFGKKPLYYSDCGKGLFFGSELKCLRAAGIPLEIESEGLRLYFQFGYLPDPWTPYRGVFKLAPGSWLRCRPGGAIETGSYWRWPAPSPETPRGLSHEGACQRLRELFDEAVRVRMIADVPLGAFLSGGIDSSSVVASMALQSDEPVKTFSIGFEEAGFNELPFAAQVAGRYQTDHHEILVRPDSVELVPRLVRHFDEPFGDCSAIPTYIVSEFAARHVKVVLSGDGGDEIFGGYQRFADLERLCVFDRVPQGLRRAVSWVADRLPYAALGKNYLRMMSRSTPLERYFERNYAPYYLRRELLNPDWMLPAESGFLMRELSHCLLPGGADVLSQAMYFETAANLTGDMLVKVDRMSMANSLEVRCPLLDHPLAEFAATLPNHWKVGPGGGKQILIRALADRLPENLLTRPKMGFGVPIAEWLRGPLRPMVQDTLMSPAFLNRGIVSAPFLRELVDEHQRRRRDNYYWIWSLLMLELWFQEAEASTTAPALVGEP